MTNFFRNVELTYCLEVYIFLYKGEVTQIYRKSCTSNNLNYFNIYRYC